MKTFVVDQKSKLLEYLFRVMFDTKKTKVRQFLKFGLISVNGSASTRYDHPLISGDRVVVETSRKAAAVTPPPFDVSIVYEDDLLIVINKPSGLLTIATEKIRERTAFFAVNDYLNRVESFKGAHRKKNRSDKAIRRKQIFVVHRLDKDASGLLVFAKDLETKLYFQEGWKKVQKKYYAVVEGRPRNQTGTITSYLRENKFLRVYSGPEAPDAKYSVTHYEVLETAENYALLEIDLETGRKHQIRVHLSEIGLPIVGDEAYGSKKNPAGRLGLHAYYLAFDHPETGKKMTFRSELPVSLARLFKPSPYPSPASGRGK